MVFYWYFIFCLYYCSVTFKHSSLAAIVFKKFYFYTVFQKNVVWNCLQYLHQLLTDFENSFTVGNSNELSAKYV